MEEISKKNPVELQKLLGEKRAELMKFRFEMSGGKVKNVKQGQAAKKDIARILTALKMAK
ncbi:MAG: 50S ribosomal protein L29 [Candidatus Taylorbacteria bacterium]|nr:50S ribosomal protein L29 [Candidatus Taylorbacteria bacterium]